MRGGSAPGSSAASGLLGTLGAWLRTLSSEFRPSSAGLAGQAEVPDVTACGMVRVLVVDDNPVNLMVISAQMESRGIMPSLAADGAEAVALASAMPFDLILMDLQMPVLDGLAATVAIRRLESDSSRPAVPVVAYSSAFPGAGVLANHGINGRLAKPCEYQELEDCLVRWCPAYKSSRTAGGSLVEDRSARAGGLDSGAGSTLSIHGRSRGRSRLEPRQGA